MSNWLKLEGDVCAVTGALGGMGVEICREFARNGANVVLLDLDEEKVKAAAADLAAEFGIHAEGYKMNATDEAEVQAAVDATIADFGRVDVLVNTAGILRFAAMEDLPLSDWGAGAQRQPHRLLHHLAALWSRDDQGRPGVAGAHLDRCQPLPRDVLGRVQLHQGGRQHDVKMLAAEWGPTASLQLRRALLR